MPPLPIVKVHLPPREVLMPELEAVLYGGIIAEGEQVYDFERRFAGHFGLTNALGVSSGTGALHIAFLCAGVEPGDEVITTSMTAEPTNTTILQMGAVPVFADVDPLTGNLDPASVERLIGPKTRAICVVHYAGYPAELADLRRLADAHGLKLIEDCAHALGAVYEGRPIGSIGHMGMFSFQAIKHMTTVDGGMLTFEEPEQVEEARRLRWFGMTKGAPRTSMDIKRVGFKYNMTNVAAVIGNRQLDTISDVIARHVENGRYFDRELAGIPGLAPARVVEGGEPSYWIYTLLSDDSDDVERRLASINVSASKLHRPNHLHTVFADCRRESDGVSEFYRRLVHIPCGWWVSDEDRERMVSVLRQG